MPYTVTSFDGNFTIDALTINTANTALALVGKNYAGWGEPYANNFTHLLENFAGDDAPDKRRTGQLWYDTLNKVLKIWDTRDLAWSDLGENALTAQRLLTPRNIAISGAASGSASFDGSANVTISVTLETLMTGVGATANSAANIPGVIYNSPAIVVDAAGRITSITNTGGDGASPPLYVSSFTGGPGGVTRSGAVTLTSADVVTALGYTPTNGGLTVLTSNAIITALGYTPVNKAGDIMLGNGDSSGNNLTHGLDFNYGPISHAGNITTYGNLRMANGGKQIDFAGNRIQNIGSPAAGSDAATKSYVDSAVGGGGGVTVSPYAPSGGSDGDVWYRY